MKTRELEERTTEEFVRVPSLLNADSETRLRAAQSGQSSDVETASTPSLPSKRGSVSLLYGSAILATVLAGSYGLYRYRQSPVVVREEQTIPGEAKSSLSSPTPRETPASSPAATAGKPKQIGKPTPATMPPKPSPTPGISAINQKKAADHLRRARELYNQSQYQQALRECNESLRLNPNQAEARELRRKISEVIRILNGR